jgi:hypothetical protein
MRGICVLSLVVQELHCLHAVLDVVEVVVHLAVLESLDRQTRVAWIVFDEQDLNWLGIVVHGILGGVGTTAE